MGLHLGKYQLKPGFKQEYETLKDQMKAKKAIGDFHNRVKLNKIKQVT
jgi:hypothetical protein